MRQELDRRMWAEIQRIGFDLIAQGQGEHLMPEPIYFGRAFTSAPVFNYSVTTDTKDDPFTPMLVVPPSELASATPDGNGLYPHSMWANYMWQDPGFEVAGQWVQYGTTDAEKIPDVHCFRQDPYTAQTILNNYEIEETPDGYRQPYFSNCWVQSAESRQRWIVTNEESHDLGFGYPGEYSAKYVFDESTSNWLVGLENIELVPGQFGGYPWGGNHGTNPWYPENDVWAWYTTDAWPTRVYSEGVEQLYFPDGFAYAVPPPIWAGWRGFVHVKSDADVEVEIWSGAINFDNVGTEVEENHIHYTDEQSTTVGVRAGEWTRVDFFHPYEDETGEYPARPANHDSIIDTFYWQQRIRMKGGSPGQAVYLDNCYVWPDLRNFTTPFVTIGVDEWIQDEHGGYIGARLWFKVGVEE